MGWIAREPSNTLNLENSDTLKGNDLIIRELFGAYQLQKLSTSPAQKKI